MAKEYHVISADGHVVEAPDMWERFLPKKYQDRAPKLVKDPLGGDGWQYEPGTPPAGIGNVTMWAGKSYDDNGWHGVKYDQINPGCYIGKDRLNEQDVGGVDAEVLFPPQRTIRYFMLNEDDGFHQAGVEAYNTWLYDDFCAADHGRLIGIAQMPNLGVENNIAALKQAKAHGFKGVICSTWPSGNEQVSVADDPFWEAAEAENMIVHLHAGIHTGARVKGSAKATAVSAAKPAGLAQMGGGIAQNLPAHGRPHSLRDLRPLPRPQDGRRRGRRGMGPRLPGTHGRSLLPQPQVDQDGPEAAAQRVFPPQLDGDLHP